MIAGQPPSAWPMVAHDQVMGGLWTQHGLAATETYLYADAYFRGLVAYRLPLHSVHLPALNLDRQKP